MAFNPPSGVADGATYGYGNVIWEYDAVFGVWNIVDGTLVGGVGPTGPAGPAGAGNLPLASYAVTGAAQFYNADFGVSVTGTVSLTGNVARTNRSNTFSAVGGNSFTYGITAASAKIANVYVSGSIISNTDPENSQPAGIGFGVSNDIILNAGNKCVIQNDFANEGQEVKLSVDQGNSQIKLESGANIEMVLSAPLENGTEGLILGSGYAKPLKVSGGIFRNPEEYASYQDLGSSNSIVINATGGTIQRFRITPSGQVTVSAGPGWDTTTTNATETIAVIVQSTNGKTGSFTGSILSNSPVLFGVTGGIDMFTVMRVKTASSALLIGLPIANGLTGTGFSIS